MILRNWVPPIVTLAAVLTISAARVEEKNSSPHEYAGSRKCRICHNVASKGKMYDVWEKTNHAHAYEKLLTDKAKDAAKKLGIDKPEKSGECLRCHATAYGTTKKPVTEKVKPEDSVGCESCHGAGKDYSTLTIMKELEKAIAAGLVYPAKGVCTTCHNAESPTWNPERYTNKKGEKVGFDFEVLWEMVKHSTPEESK
jgi:hypothetical protein